MMMNSRQKAMEAALHARKARGLDIAQIVGGSHPMQETDDEQKELGLAPEGNPVDEEHEKEVENVAEQGHDGIKDMAHDEMPSHYEKGDPADADLGDKHFGAQQKGISNEMAEGGHGDEEADKALVHQEIAKMGLGKGSLSHKAFMKRGAGKKY